MIILLVYHMCICFIGYWITRSLFRLKGTLFGAIVASVLFGLLVSIPITYSLAIIFRHFPDPIETSLLVYSFGILIWLWFRRNDIGFAPNASCNWNVVKRALRKRGVMVDILVVFFCLAISSYVMTKTFKEDTSGSFYVARNAVFDFGHSLSIIRSMSWGNNIPYSSPFVSQTPHLYHFMFNFWSAIFEHQGLPIGLAVNIPSIFGFALLLLVMHELGIAIFKRRLVGLLSILFMLFHGGLMFLDFFRKFGLSPVAILRSPNYLFAGPFDGSIYSIFLTLNVFVNQRHLGFSLAVFFLLYSLFIQELDQKTFRSKQSVLFGLLVGFFVLWHITISLGLFFIFLVFLIFRKKWGLAMLLGISTAVVSLFFLFPWIPSFLHVIKAIPKGALAVQSVSYGGNNMLTWAIQFMIMNFGIGLLFFAVGIKNAQKIAKNLLPLFILPVLFFVLNVRSGFIDQKYLNIFQVLFSLFLASGIVSVWDKKRIGKILAVLIVPFLLLSGIIDFMVIKNDYMYKVPNTNYGELVHWIAANTPKSAVFVAGRNIFDPVTLAGRKSYYGFFRQFYILSTGSDEHRARVVQTIYEAGSEEMLKTSITETHADYILFPKASDENFSYKINEDLLLKTYSEVYDDKNYVILKIN